MSLFATLGLIAVTLAYVIFNWRMVREMRETRRLTVLPKLAINFSRVGPAHALVAVKNVGPGAALDVRMTLTFVPRDPAQQAPDVRPWRINLMPPGDEHDFLPRDLTGDAIAATWERITISGTMKNALGETIAIDDTFADLPEWRRLLEKAQERWLDVPEKRLASAFGDLVGKPTTPLGRALREISAAISRGAARPSTRERKPAQPA
jgi:hypothetical protein